ncbi:MAG: urea ABC transporter permease subunit UrtB, partial [Pseudomonadota bacterium]
RWRDKGVYQRESDGRFFYLDGDDIIDVATGERAGPAPEDLTNIKPNGGVRRAIGTALVQFQLSDPDLAKRQEAVASIARDPQASQLAPLQASITGETDAGLLRTKERLTRMMVARFSEVSADRVAAISPLANDLSVDVRAVLNQILTVERDYGAFLPEGVNVARVLEVGVDISPEEAYALLVETGDALPLTTTSDIRDALEQNMEGGRVGSLPVAQLNSEAARLTAYRQLADEGLAPALVDNESVAQRLSDVVFFDLYTETDAAVTAAAAESLASVETRVALNQTLDLGLDALSLASIYFLAAIGLAITFGVMGVINMAHGEFIMMGAYTGFVIQQLVPNYTLAIIVALPVAFCVTFGAGVTMERLVIRRLYHRPLETLLATFGISIALQQLAKNIFGTQARPLTSPGWLDGAWVLNDVVSISYIRIAIFVLALIFLALILYILKRTRLGLEVRAVTQNPRMAASMGINPDKINMLTFGLGSGIAGIAGVAIGLYAKVTSEMGADYIVQSFMTVVVGGVGNVWGTLAGAGMIGGLQKVIEWLNPSNTLAAQTYMILFIILFIQFRPKGIVALKGRAAGD